MMSSSMDKKTNLLSVMKDISEALMLDRNDKNEDAYRKYLQCVLRITTKLLRNLHSDDGHLQTTPEVCKFVKLGQQCMDRVASIVSEKTAADRAAKSRDISLSFTAAPAHPGHTGYTPSGEIRCQQSQGVLSPGTPGERVVPEPGSLTSPDSPSRSVTSDDKTLSRSGSKKLTPMEMAAWQNKQLLSAFKARQAQALKVGNKSVNANLSLTLQRKMAENMAIAKAQEHALAKKMKERHQRLEEQAARRFHAPLGLSEEEHYQRLVYRQVLEFEQEEIWMIDWRRRLEENPTDIDIISQLVEQILCCESHPLTQQLKAYQEKTLSKVSRLVEKKLDTVARVAVPIPQHLLSTLTLFHKPEDQMPSLSEDTTSNTNKSASSHTDIDQSEELSTSHDSSAISQPNSMQDLKENTMLDAPSLEKLKIKEDQEDESESSHTETGDTNMMSGEIESDSSSLELETKNMPQTDDSSIDVNDNVVSSNQDSHSEDTLASVTSDIKIDLKKAIIQSEQLREKLLDENKASSTVVRQSTEENELYNQENMDDLFDDDSDDQCDTNSMNTFGTPEPTNLSQSYIQLKRTNNEHDTTTKPRSNSAPGFSCGTEEKETDGKTPTSSNTTGKGLHKNSFGNIDKRINNLKNEAYHRHLHSITEDIVASIEKIQVLFVIAFEQLDSAVGRDQCNVLLEAYFFKPLWHHLMVLFRLANEPKEIAIAHTMTRLEAASPLEFGVREKLCLRPANNDQSYAYEPAVTEFCRLLDCCTMLEKMDCLVKTSHLVLHCVEQYYRQPDRQREHKPSIGADDLLPILCYVVSKSRLPQVVSECHAIDSFIHEGYMYGEEGYCLTSFQTAVNYLVSQGMKQ